MILTNFWLGGTLRMGVKRGSTVLDVTAASDAGLEAPGSAQALYSTGFPALKQLEVALKRWDELGEFYIDEGEVTYASPISAPGKLLCVGLNYRKHAAESGMAEPKEPVLFSKFNNSLAADHDEVAIGGLTQVDYEAELALVIGKKGKNIPVEDALGYVLGYLNANDLSERRLQFVSGQWLLGKTLDRFMPLGPYVVTADEAGDPADMSIRSWVNGELRQDSNSSDMIFSVAQIVSYASRFMTLEPGDVISTGTPEGVAMGQPEPDWLKPGDRVEVEVGDLGRLTNVMVEEL